MAVVNALIVLGLFHLNLFTFTQSNIAVRAQVAAADGAIALAFVTYTMIRSQHRRRALDTSRLRESRQ